MNRILTLKKETTEPDTFEKIYKDPRIILDVNDLTFAYNAKKNPRPTLRDISIDIRGLSFFPFWGPTVSGNPLSSIVSIKSWNRLPGPYSSMIFPFPTFP